MELRRLMALAIEQKASDLHVKVNAPPALRLHGSLEAIQGAAPLTAGDTENMLFEITSDAQRAALEAQRELDFAYTLEGGERFRVNASYQRSTVSLVLRHIPASVPLFGQLGLPEGCKSFAEKRHGLVLVTGATGSGKSTTLASMIDHINRTRRARIVTIEDPIEFVHEDKLSFIAQREIGSDTRSFAEALRRSLRQDPDVILIGEMRDLETIGAALMAAETGHLVFGTLHTNNAPASIDRIIDVFPSDQQAQIRLLLSTVLEGVISMTLFPRADGQGRVAAVEVLVATSAVRNLIREGKTFQIYNAMQMGGQTSSQTMEQAIRSLLERRLIKPEAAGVRV